MGYEKGCGERGPRLPPQRGPPCDIFISSFAYAIASRSWSFVLRSFVCFSQQLFIILFLYWNKQLRTVSLAAQFDSQKFQQNSVLKLYISSLWKPLLACNLNLWVIKTQWGDLVDLFSLSCHKCQIDTLDLYTCQCNNKRISPQINSLPRTESSVAIINTFDRCPLISNVL